MTSFELKTNILSSDKDRFVEDFPTDVSGWKKLIGAYSDNGFSYLTMSDWLDGAGFDTGPFQFAVTSTDFYRPVPEPASVVLLGSGLRLLTGIGRKQAQ